MYPSKKRELSLGLLVMLVACDRPASPPPVEESQGEPPAAETSQEYADLKLLHAPTGRTSDIALEGANRFVARRLPCGRPGSDVPRGLPVPDCGAQGEATGRLAAVCRAVEFWRKRYRRPSAERYLAYRRSPDGWVVEINPAPHCSRGGGHLVYIDADGELAGDWPQR